MSFLLFHPPPFSFLSALLPSPCPPHFSNFPHSHSHCRRRPTSLSLPSPPAPSEPSRPPSLSLSLSLPSTPASTLQDFTTLHLHALPSISPLQTPTSISPPSTLIFHSPSPSLPPLGTLNFLITPSSPGSSLEVLSSCPPASLPGERRLIRNFHRALLAHLPTSPIHLLHKPPNIRLVAPSSQHYSQKSLSTPLIALIPPTSATPTSISAYLSRWDPTLRTSFNATGPALRTQLITRIAGSHEARGGRIAPDFDPLLLRTPSGATVSARVRVRADKTLLVTVATDRPRDRGVRALLKELSWDLSTAFLDTRVHWPR